MTSVPSFQPKLIYLAKRNPALSRAEFVQRWRQHGALGMSLPRWRNIARYVHCDVLHPENATPKLADDYDGIGLIWHRSPEARAAHLADSSSRSQMERDEFETFAEPVGNFCLLARETVLRPPDKAASIKLTRFLNEQSQSQRSPGHGHVINETLPPERGDRWGLPYAYVEELWFTDIDAALQAAEQSDALTVLTNEVLLYEK